MDEGDWMMKNKLNWFLISLFSLFLTNSIIAIALGGVTVDDHPVYFPYPAEPGKYIDLWVRVQYLGTTSIIENVTCALEPAYPFSVESGDETEIYIGTLAPYKESLLKFRIRIDVNAVTGYNNLKFKCKIAGIGWSQTNFQIYIQAHDAILSVEKAISTPAEFEPGQTGKLEIILKNIAGIRLKDITVELDLTGIDIPFAPVNSTIEKRIQKIESGEEQPVLFNVVAFPDAQSKVYKIPLKLAYYDELGKNYSKDTIVSLVVASKPGISLAYEPTGTIKNGTKSSITISIVNKGLSGIRFLTAKIGPSQEYELLSPSEVYVGDINSDDSETAQFDLYINTSRRGIQLPITVAFKDISGKDYLREESVTVNVYTQEEAIRLGLEKPSTFDPIIIVLLAIIGIYILYRIIKLLFRKK